MAATITLVAASRNQLKYKMIADAGADAATIGATGGASPDFITDSKTGSLIRQLLGDWVLDTDISAPSSAVQSRVALFERNSLNIYTTPRDADSNWVLAGSVSGSKLVLTCTASAADALGTYLIIEARHTAVR